jgi:hypothetical protein
VSLQGIKFSKFILIWSGLVAGLSSIPLAHAVRITPHATSMPTCAVLENFSGEVQILDSTRSRLLDTFSKAPIPCGSWVSVVTGWASLVHREGYRVKLAANTFVEVPEPSAASTGAGDQFMLFRGQIYAISGDGSKELRVATANSRARMSRGRFILVFNHSEEETQLITLANRASLENRFENSRKILAKAGESSTLNFKMLRVVPSAPRAISETAMKVKMDELAFDDRERVYALKVVRLRQERKLAVELDSDPESVRQARIRDSASGRDVLIQAGSAARADLAIAEKGAAGGAGEDFPENFDPMAVKFPDDAADFSPPKATKANQSEKKSHPGSKPGHQPGSSTGPHGSTVANAPRGEGSDQHQGAPGNPHAPQEQKRRSPAEVADAYRRSRERPEDAPLKSRWHRKIAGESQSASALLFPGQRSAAEDVDWNQEITGKKKKGLSPKQKQELLDKRKLMDELKRIRPED